MTKLSQTDQADPLRQKMNDSKQLLPPRSAYHANKNTKNSLKVRFPMIRLLVFAFIFLLLVAYSVILFKDKSEHSSPASNPRFEKVDMGSDESKEGKQDPITINDEDSDSFSDDANQELTSETENNDPPVTENPSGTNGDSDDSDDSPAPAAQQMKPEKEIIHVVQQNETLFSISMKYFQSKDGIESIRKWNNISGNDIKRGQKLVLYIPAS